MSVPEGKRTKSAMEVHIKAQELAVYTAKILSNEKIFDSSVDKEIINRIRNCAYDICVKAWSANKIRANTNQVNREMRYRLQQEAIALCDQMLTYIGIAKQVFHLRSKRMKYWTEQITNTQRLLQAWKESDVSRYGQP